MSFQPWFSASQNMLWWAQQGALKIIKGVEHVRQGETERAGAVQPEEVMAQGDLIKVYKYLRGEVKKMKPDASQWYLVKGKRQWPQTEIQKILLRKNFITVRAVKQWKRLPREVVALPFLKILKPHLDMVLSSLF